MGAGLKLRPLILPLRRHIHIQRRASFPGTAFDYFPRVPYLRCRSSRPRSGGIRRRRGPRRRGRLRRCRTGRTPCCSQSPPGRCAARSCPGWTGRGSASALQGEAKGEAASGGSLETIFSLPMFRDRESFSGR